MERGKGGRAVLAAVALWILHDLVVPPRYAVDAQAALFAIDAYRARVSPHLQGVIQCRFSPSCSYYGRESVRRFGFMRGSARAAWRIARCGPWTPIGTVDPP